MRALLALAAILVVSCGGPQATSTAVTLPTPSASASPIATTSVPDLSPVAPPDGLIATIRLAHPRHSLDQWSSLVKSLGAPKLAFDLDDVAKDEIGARIVAALDLDASVDIIVVKASGSEWVPGGAVSVALNPGDAAMDLLAHGFELEQKSDGSIAIRKAVDGGAPRDDDDDAGDDEIADDTRCVIAPQTGAAARRIVCAYGEVELATVVPYLTRTLARQTSSQTADFRAEVLLDRQREMIRKLEGMADDGSSGSADDPGEALAARFAKEAGTSLVSDIDAVVFEATSDDDAVSLAVSVRFGRATSPFTRALLSNGDGAGPPQAAFWQLPSDTTFAAYTHGALAKDLDPLRAQAFPALEGILTASEMPKKYIDLELGALRSVFLTGGPMVVGGGFDSAAARTALAAYVALGKDTLAARTKARAAIQGWTLVELDEPASRWISAIKDLVAADKLQVKPKKTKTNDTEKEKSVIVVTPTAASLGLPAGTFHFEQRTTPRPPPAKKPGDRSSSFVPTPPIAHTTHFFVVPDGGSTWIAVGEDATSVAARVKSALAAAPPAGTMKGRSGIERLATTKTTSGMFATIGWMALTFLDSDSDSALRDASSWLDKIARWPSRGATPIESFITPIAPSEGGLGGRTITYRLPRGALADIVNAF
jgi:hypothetical protein